MKLEMLALKWAVTEKFKDYLMGTSFTVYTDNNPLTYAMTTAKLRALEQRWVAQLQSFNFTIKYRAGKVNANADALSRMPNHCEGDGVELEGAIDISAVTAVATPISTELQHKLLKAATVDGKLITTRVRAVNTIEGVTSVLPTYSQEDIRELQAADPTSRYSCTTGRRAQDHCHEW